VVGTATDSRPLSAGGLGERASAIVGTTNLPLASTAAATSVSRHFTSSESTGSPTAAKRSPLTAPATRDGFQQLARDPPTGQTSQQPSTCCFTGLQLLTVSENDAKEEGRRGSREGRTPSSSRRAAPTLA